MENFLGFIIIGGAIGSCITNFDTQGKVSPTIKAVLGIVNLIFIISMLSYIS